MGRGRIERDRIGLKNPESFILELSLLVYPLLLVKEDAVISPHYLLLMLAIVAAFASYLLFTAFTYSFIAGLLISVFIAVPFYLIGMPFAVVGFVFMYTFWRMHANFGTQRVSVWPFILINTIIFTCFYFITRNYLLKAHAFEVNKVNVFLFLLTTVLFICLRFITIWHTGRRLNNFRLGEASKVFAGLLGAGVAVFLAIYFLITYVRTAVITISVFLFGGLFTLFGKVTEPVLYSLIALRDYLKYKDYIDVEVESVVPHSPEFEAGRKVYGAIQSNGNTIIIGVVVFLAIIVLITIIWKRKLTMGYKKDPLFTFQTMGRSKKKSKQKVQSTYDYSLATNAVRNAFKNFELNAVAAKSPRFTGETVQEWFLRMGWESNETVLETYEKARYGSYLVSEEEGHLFINELQKIKNTLFF